MAPHNLETYFNFLFSILHQKVSKMLRRVFSLIWKICFMIQMHEFFKSLTRTNTPFLVLKWGSPSFSDLDNFWILIWKLSYVSHGEIVVSFENNFWLPKSAQSTQTVEKSHSFFNVSYTWYKSLVSTKEDSLGQTFA